MKFSKVAEIFRLASSLARRQGLEDVGVISTGTWDIEVFGSDRDLWRERGGDGDKAREGDNSKASGNETTGAGGGVGKPWNEAGEVSDDTTTEGEESGNTAGEGEVDGPKVASGNGTAGWGMQTPSCSSSEES